MSSNFLGSQSFRIRTKVSIGIVLIVLIGAFTPNAIGLRAVYCIAALIGLYEIDSIIGSSAISPRGFFLGTMSLGVLLFSAVYVIAMPRGILIIGIALTIASDTGAYMVGKICGTKLIHSRPLPNISPKKSWEGIVGGIVIPGLAAPIVGYFFRNSLPGQPFSIMSGCLAGLCAIAGDAYESAFKRQCGVKDANDFLKDARGFQRIEALLGGSEGHGGYYDRLDSMSMVLLIWGIVTTSICFTSP